jgi:predicted dehydrogenase
MADTYLGVGVVGIGWVSHPHIAAWLKNGHCRVAAVCSRDRENAQAAVERHGLQDCQVYTDYEQMLRQDNLDIIDICSLNTRHADQGIAAAEAGKHVLIEKPVAMTLDDLRRLDTAIGRAKVKSLAGFVLHWSPYFEMVKSMIRNDVLGTLFYGETGYMSGRWPKDDTRHDWLRTKQEGGNSLLLSGCHAVDALRQFMPGEVDEVMCYAGSFTGECEYDATMVLLLHFDNGTIGKVASIVEGNVPYSFLVRLHGSKGTLVQNRFYAEMLEGQTGWAEVPTIMPDTAEVTHHPFQGQMDHFVDCIMHDRTPMPDIADAVKTHEILFAAEQSSRERKPIRLPLTPKRDVS